MRVAALLAGVLAFLPGDRNVTIRLQTEEEAQADLTAINVRDDEE